LFCFFSDDLALNPLAVNSAEKHRSGLSAASIGWRAQARLEVSTDLRNAKA